MVTGCVWEMAVWHTPVTADGSQQTVVWRVGASGTFNAPVLTTAFSSLPKSHYLFSFIEILENKSKTRMFDITSETRDITYMIILKSRLLCRSFCPHALVSWHLHWLTTAPSVILHEGSLFDSLYTKVYGRALLLSQDWPTLPLIHTL